MLEEKNMKYSFIFDENFFTSQEKLEISKKENDKLKEKKIKDIEEYRSSDYQIYIDTMNKTNSMLDTVGKFSGVASIYVEHKKTTELRKQIKSKEKALDSLLDETYKRAEIHLQEEKERNRLEIEHMKKCLQVSLEKIKHEEEMSKYKLNLDFNDRRKKFNIFDDARKQVLNTLEYTKKMIDNEKMTKNKYYLQMNEQYKECMKYYSTLIKNYVRGDI